MVPLKYLSNFWRTLEMPLINCETINCESLTWSSICIITNSTGAGIFKMTNTKFYVPAVTLSAQDNSKLLQQLKSELLARNTNLNHLFEPSFQGINRHFILAFENDTQRTSHFGYYLPNVELKDCDIMINGENVFDQPVKKQ